MTKTLVVSFVMLFAMAVLSAVVCFCVSKDLKDRLNKVFITEEQMKKGEEKKYDNKEETGLTNKVKKGMVIV